MERLTEKGRRLPKDTDYIGMAGIDENGNFYKIEKQITFGELYNRLAELEDKIENAKFVIVCNEWNFRLNELVFYADGKSQQRILVNEEVADGILKTIKGLGYDGQREN